MRKFILWQQLLIRSFLTVDKNGEVAYILQSLALWANNLHSLSLLFPLINEKGKGKCKVAACALKAKTYSRPHGYYYCCCHWVK